MVHLINMDNNEKVMAREIALNLMNEKERIEREIAQYKDILDNNGVGMNGSLIDSEGYPRGDVDVYNVRHARNRIICLQNDHKSLMKKIEDQLHVALAPDPDSIMDHSDSTRPTTPQHFAVIGVVEPASPAYEAGLQREDKLIRFGSVNYDNFTSTADIARVVQHSENRSIEVTVLRSANNTQLKLSLRPKKWAGPGLLGCTLLQTETPDR